MPNKLLRTTKGFLLVIEGEIDALTASSVAKQLDTLTGDKWAVIPNTTFEEEYISKEELRKMFPKSEEK